MVFRKFRYIIIIALILSPISVYSQFTYIDISVGNKFMKFSKQRFESYRSKYNQTNIHVNGLWRFKRHFGIGMTASIPVRQGGKYLIIGENGHGLNKYEIDPTKLNFNYYFKESAKVSFNGRLYGGVKGNFYLDGRISFFSFTEHLMSNYPGLTYSEENKFKQIAPGFSIGMQPHLGKNITMNINMGWDFYKFKDVGFKNAGPTESYLAPIYQSYDSTFFKSQLPDKKAAFSINIGLGYFF